MNKRSFCPPAGKKGATRYSRLRQAKATWRQSLGRHRGSQWASGGELRGTYCACHYPHIPHPFPPCLMQGASGTLRELGGGGEEGESVFFETNCYFLSRTLLLSNISSLVCKTSPTRAMSSRSVPLKCLPEAGLIPLPTKAF